MIFTLDNKIFSEQPPPSLDILHRAVDEAFEYCSQISREIKRCDNLSDYQYLRRFYSDSFYTVGVKISAIKRLNVTFRNEAYSISRDLTEIVIDVAWIWHYFELQNDPELAEQLCRQFYYNTQAYFLENFCQIKSLYLNNPFIKKFYTEKKLDTYKVEYEKTIGNYKYKSNWRCVSVSQVPIFV